MSDRDFVRMTAGKPELYPEMDKLIRTIRQEGVSLRDIRDVFVGLAKADVRGYICVGDEHEWAAIALRANQLGTVEGYGKAAGG